MPQAARSWSLCQSRRCFAGALGAIECGGYARTISGPAFCGGHATEELQQLGIFASFAHKYRSRFFGHASLSFWLYCMYGGGILANGCGKILQASRATHSAPAQSKGSKVGLATLRWFHAQLTIDCSRHYLGRHAVATVEPLHAGGVAIASRDCFGP